MNRRMARFLFYIAEVFRRENVGLHLKELESNQYQPREEIERIQRQKLNRLLKFVIANNGFYRKKYEGYDVFSQFTELPPLKKEELRDNYKNIISYGNWTHLDLVETSGSTGIPLRFYRDRVTFGYSLACLYRGHRWWDLNIGDMEAMLWGVPVSFKNRFKARMRDIVLNRFREREYNINPSILLDFYRKLLRKKPDYIFGYSSMVYEFALFLKKRALNGRKLKLKAAICTSEQMYKFQKDLTESVLGARVVNEYGSTETGVISYECKQGVNHICDDCVYVEIVDENYTPLPDGQIGRVLVTVLNSFASPIIRYDLGDLAKKETISCACGIGLSSISDLQGRTSDIVLAPDGRAYHSIIFYYIIKDLFETKGGIKNFKVRQTAINRLEFHIIKDNYYSVQTESFIKGKIGEIFGRSMNLDFFYPEQIDRDRPRKFRDFETTLDTENIVAKAYSDSILKFLK
jgi:phenylacetate-CoA ligase